MKSIFLPVLLFAFMSGCRAQGNQKPSNQDTTAQIQNRPNVVSRVNKKFDEKGNLISYDSSSVWSYSSDGTTRNIVTDSLLVDFTKHLDPGFPILFRNNFGDQNWTDSIFFRDFFSSGYFPQKWDYHDFEMSQLMQQMDSLTNSLIKNNYSGLAPPHKG